MSVDLELPAWYIDEVVLDDFGLPLGAPYLAVFNRTPEPSETNVPIGTLISLDLGTDNTDSPDETQTQVFITLGAAAEVLAFDGGTFESGWNGIDSSTSTPDATTLRIVIDPETDLDPLIEVRVRIVTESTNGLVLNSEWTFLTEDLIPPVFLSAKARTKKIVRLTFDEPVVMGSVDDPSSALNPVNYSFDRLTVPAVNVVASSVEQVTSSSVDVTLDIEMTPGALYRVTGNAIEDLVGNAMSGATAQFTGYVPMSPASRDFDIYRMIPRRNREQDASILDWFKFAACLQEVTNLLLCSIDEWTDILDPDLAPESFLDAMLDDLGNPFGFDLDVIDKRKLIRVLVDIYRQKGTAIGIINVVRFFVGIEVEVNSFSEEGWDLGVDDLGETTVLGPGTLFALYSFEVVSPVPLTDEERSRIRSIARYMKPAHTHLVAIVEPLIPDVIDHLELGISELSPAEWILH